MKKLINYFLITCLILLNFNLKEVHAAELAGGIGYSGTVSQKATVACGGTYEAYQWDAAAEGTDECRAGTDHTTCVIADEEKTYADNGVLRHNHITWSCADDCGEHDNTGEECCQANRYWKVHTKCNRCGSTGQSGNFTDSCSISSTHGGHHWAITDEYGRAKCRKCGTIGVDYQGGCNVSKTSTIKVTWNNSCTRTFQGATGTVSATASEPRIQVDYNSNATLKYSFTNKSTYCEVSGYTWYKDGVAVYTATTVKGSNYSSASLSVSGIVDSGAAYQLRFTVKGVGTFTTSPIYIDCAVKVNVQDTILSNYSTQALTSWTDGLAFNSGAAAKTYKSDLVNGNNVNRDNSLNTALFKITDTNYGGDGTLHGPAEVNTTYLKGWNPNATESSSTSSSEPYAGSGGITSVNHYHTGYYYSSASNPVLIKHTNYFTTMYRYFKPITYTVKFVNAYGTSYNGDTTNYNKTWTMPNMSFTYDRGQKLSANQYVRKYYVTLANREPWLSSPTTNSASRWVPYTFVGWKQGNTPNGTSPYYEVTSTADLFGNQEAVGNLTNINNGTVNLQATWKSSTITLPNTVTGSNGFTFIDWSHKAYPDTRVYDKAIASNVDDVSHTIKKNTAYKPYKDITLYAHWYKDVTLTFNLNGGKMKQNGSNIVLKGTFYDYEPGYTFNIYKGLTAQSKGKYDKQVGTIDAYGTYNSNGENKLYTKTSSDGTIYRFLGWSLDKNATVPDSNFDVFNSGRKTTYNIKDNTVLYAVWEPVLQANILVDRTLGSLAFDNGTLPDGEKSGLDSSDGEQTISLLLRPGEQGFYQVESSGRNDLTFKIAFDTRITDIYTHGDSDSEWHDNLNPSTSEDLKSGQGHGLNRQITGKKNFIRKFHIPQYLGTHRSYDTSNPDKTNNPVNKYVAVAVLSQQSYFYNKVYGKEEQIIVNVDIYISTSGGGGNIPTVLDEIRSRVRIIIQ